MDLRAIGLGVAFALMWSSAFSSARIIVQDAPPLGALALRFLISGLLGVALAWMAGQRWRLTPAQWGATVLFGICQNALYLGFNFVAMQTVEAALATIIASTMPLLVAAAGWGLLRERLPGMAVAGLVAGFAGVVLILGSRLGAGADPFGVLLCMLGALSLAGATLALRGAGTGGNVLMMVGLQMLVGTAVLVPASLALETFEVRWSWPLVLAFAYTTLVPGLLGTWVWFVLVRRVGPVRAASFHFLNPFFGVALAAVLLGETVRSYDLLGVAVVMAGIFAVQTARPGPYPPR